MYALLLGWAFAARLPTIDVEPYDGLAQPGDRIELGAVSAVGPRGAGRTRVPAPGGAYFVTPLVAYVEDTVRAFVPLASAPSLARAPGGTSAIAPRAMARPVFAPVSIEVQQIGIARFAVFVAAGIGNDWTTSLDKVEIGALGAVIAPHVLPGDSFVHEVAVFVPYEAQGHVENHLSYRAVSLYRRDTGG